MARSQTEPRLNRVCRGIEFLVLDALVKRKGLQALVQIVYQMLDKTRNVVLQIDSGSFRVLSMKHRNLLVCWSGFRASQ